MQQKARKKSKKNGKQNAIEIQIKQATEKVDTMNPAFQVPAPALNHEHTSTTVKTAAPVKLDPPANQVHDRNLVDIIHHGPDFERIEISFGLVLADSDTPHGIWEKSLDASTFTDLLNTNQAQLKFFEGRTGTKHAAAAYGLLFMHEANLDQAALDPQYIVSAKLRLNNAEILAVEILSEGCGAGSLLWPSLYIWAHLVHSAWDAQLLFSGKCPGLDDEIQQGLDAFAASLSPAPEEGHMSCKVKIPVNHAGQRLFEVLNLKYITRHTRQDQLDF